ncbi:MAG TPA: CoA transferase [Acidimicrobiales bacterium]|nr:CoA transferase [Acidimicrobiales bacterium]
MEDRQATAVHVHDAPTAMLSGVRVLDLTNTVGTFCGKVLADLGADVLKIEPVGGSDERTMPPFATRADGRQESLWWRSFNRRKRGVTLDVRSPSGLELLGRLAEGSQVLIQSAYSAADLPLDPARVAELRAAQPRLVCTTITPYGWDGPRAAYRARDITLQGMGTYMYVTGDGDRPPVRIGGDIAYCHAGSQAAAATVLALYGTRRSGRGQVVDVSAQEAIVWTLLNTTMAWDVAGVEETRGGGVMRKERASDLYTRLVWPCRDGWVHFVPIGGGGGFARRSSFAKFVEWMHEEGVHDPVLGARDWNGKDANDISQAEYDRVAAVILEFLGGKTQSELFERALRDGVLLAPIEGMADVLRNPQLAARGFWDAGGDADFPDAVFPGPFARCSGTPLLRGGRSPELGEHNPEVYEKELGIAPSTLERLASAGVV